jgi:hypothetical protein
VWGRCLVRADNRDWVIKSVLQGTTDLTDRAIEFRPGHDVTGVQIVLTDRVTEVVPRVTDDSGAPTDDFVLLAYPEDPEKRGEQSRFIRTFTPSLVSRNSAAEVQRAAGLRALPPGSYHVVALEDLLYEDMRDPGFYEALVRHTTPLVLAEGERRAIQLRRIRFPAAPAR